MPNVKLVSDGKALYRKDAIAKYGVDVVDAVTPFATGKAHIPGHPERISFWRAYRITDLEEVNRRSEL